MYLSSCVICASPNLLLRLDRAKIDKFRTGDNLLVCLPAWGGDESEGYGLLSERILP